MSQVDVVLLQFALGAFALVLRYFSRPFVACCRRCGSCLYSCLCCLCMSRAKDADEIQPAPGLGTWLSTHAAVRWYWFHLAMQFGFLTREFMVISALQPGRWRWEVLVSYCSICATYLVVFFEVSHFSSVRNQNLVTKITVDGLLDMLLLPVNLGFFGHLCVRKLSLQPEEHPTQIISTLVESSEIWEAWALWSVLGLFVTVVDVESRRDPAGHELVVPFKNLSIQGVRTWVFMIMAITATRLVMTFLQLRAPTVCFWASKSCSSCLELYEHNLHLAAAAVNFILCSFALAFVFTFEHSFDEYLREIGPFWKFWGVKGVVSVTYFQWLVLSYGPFDLDGQRIYLLHSLLSTVEMPLLALIHATCAYPYGQPWLDYLLRLQSQDMAGARVTIFDVDWTVSTRQAGDLCNCLFYLLVWTIGCVASHCFVTSVLPVHRDFDFAPGIFNKSCTEEGDIWHYLSSHPDLHVQLRNDTMEKHRQPNVGGAWLLLCGQTDLDCAPGFHGSPKLQCSPVGAYGTQGTCKRIRCGQPQEELGHARLRSDGAIRRWTSDMEITYECLRGYVGKVLARCGKDGRWQFSGECTEVICPHAPLVDRAKPLLEPHELETRTWQAGTSLRYQCQPPFTGTVTATCEDDGHFSLHGRCVALCAPPPHLARAVAAYSEDTAKQGFFEGLRVKYDCLPGYGGTLFATCREDGKYSVEGGCRLLCGDLEPFLGKRLGSAWKDLFEVNGSESFDLTGTGEADLVPLRCSLGLSGQPVAACHRGQWRLLGEPCQPFQTSMGCRCKRQWKRCTGLLQNDCLRWHGCGESGSYGWCQVESGCRNTWDYCVGQGEQEDPKVEMASETPAVLLRICLFLGVALLAASAVLWMCKFRMPPRPQPPALMDPPAVELRTQRRQSH